MFVLVLAKEPVPGRVKTRLCPPCTPQQAARLAQAALADTLDAACRSGADEVVVALDGTAGDWLPAGVRVVGQGEGSLPNRLAAAWSAAVTATGTTGVQIGMDTPQITPQDLDDALARLDRPAADAVLGLATDGGWWAIGLPADIADHGSVFEGVATSRPTTGVAQYDRMLALGLHTELLPTMTDVDRFADAVAVADTVDPARRFAREIREVRSELSMEAATR